MNATSKRIDSRSGVPVVRPIHVNGQDSEKELQRSTFGHFIRNRISSWEKDLGQWLEEARLYAQLLEISGNGSKGIAPEITTLIRLNQMISTDIPNLRVSLQLFIQRNEELNLDHLNSLQAVYEELKSEFSTLKMVALEFVTDSFPIRFY